MDGIQHTRDFSGIKDAIGSFEYVGNSFWEKSANFIIMDTKVTISAESCQGAEAIGIELSYHPMKSRLENQSE